MRKPLVEDADSALARTEAWWREWSGRCRYEGAYRDEVLTSLIALKAMTSETTGAVIAAPTTSLPEEIGGARNWDYRYCWLRDSVLALEALLDAGYTDEALAFRDFLLRVKHRRPGNDPDHVRDRRRAAADGVRAPGASGYARTQARPVGNASEQFQLDVHGEVAAVIFIGSRSSVGSSGGYGPAGGPSSNTSRRSGVSPTTGSGRRGPAAAPRTPRSWLGSYSIAVRIAERFELEAPIDRWKRTDEIHREVCERGYDRERRTFTQYYGSKELDASVLNIPIVGFLPEPTSASAGPSTRSRASRPRRLRLSLFDRRDRRRIAGRRGSVPGLLVLAGQRART